MEVALPPPSSFAASSFHHRPLGGAACRSLPPPRSNLGSTLATVLPIQGIHGSQVGRLASSHYRPHLPQHTHSLPLVQDARPEFPASSSSARCVLWKDRPFRRLPTHTGTPTVPQVPSLHPRGHSVFFQRHTLRPQHQSQGVHAILEDPSAPSQSSGPSYLRLSRRLAGLAHRPPGLPIPPFDPTRYPPALGILGQPKKVPTKPSATNHVSGYSMARQEQYGLPGAYQPRESSRVNFALSQAHLLNLETVPTPSGHSELSGPPGARRQSLVHAHSRLSSKPSPIVCSFSSPDSASHSLPSKPLVGDSLAPHSGFASCSSPHVAPLDGRVRHRMGSSLLRRLDCLGSLAAPSRSSSHHSQGISHGSPGPSRPSSPCGDGDPLVLGLPVHSSPVPETGITSVAHAPTHLQHYGDLSTRSPASSHGQARPRPQEHLGGLPLSESTYSHRLDASSGYLPVPGASPSSPTTGGPIRSPGQRPSSSLLRSPPVPSGSGSGCPTGGLESVEISVPVSSSAADPASPRQTSGLPGGSSSHSTIPSFCSVVAPLAPTGLNASGPLVSVSTNTDGPGVETTHPSTIQDVIQLSRLDFITKYLHLSLGPSASPALAAEIAEAHRKATRSQYQGAWTSFQRWVADHNLTSISKASLLSYLSFLLSERSFSPRTVLVHRAALKLPLLYAFNISTSDLEFHLLARSQFIARPPKRVSFPQWSLSKVLSLLESPAFNGPNTSLVNRFQKTLFLVALASGNRVSELSAIQRHCIAFSKHRSKVTLPVKETFLFKNQRPNRIPPPIRFTALMTGNKHHKVCPVANLEKWIRASNHFEASALFVSPKTGLKLSSASLSKHLCHLINRADPGRVPKAHDIRKVAASLAWARGVTLENILDQGFWSGLHVFSSHYLIPTDPRPGRCVALRSA